MQTLRLIVLLVLWSSFHGPAVATGAAGVADASPVRVAAEKAAGSLEQVWSLPGSWSGIVTEQESGNVLVATRSALVEIDSTGRTVRETPFRRSPRLRSAKFASGQVLLSFSTWSPQVTVYDQKGALLWAYPPATGSSGIDDVAAVDVDGDGNDEVVVGFNGSTGVHVLSSKGSVIWTSTTIGNVWHVDGGDLRGNGQPQVVTTSAAGQVHIFSADGSDRVNIAPGFYAGMVRVGRISAKDNAASIFAAGRLARSTTLNVAAFAGDGTKKWESSIDASGTAFAQAATLATTRPWLAVSLQSGEVFVLDATNGTVIGSADGQDRAEVAWLTEKSGGAPLLVVSSTTALRAFRIKDL